MKRNGIKTDEDRWLGKIKRMPMALCQQQRKDKKKSLEIMTAQSRKILVFTSKARKARRALNINRLKRLLKDDPREFLG
jgi:hypothetical protein